MKRTFLLLGLAVAAVVYLSSCKDDLTNDSFENGSATITGVAYANLDLTNDTVNGFEIDYEFAPAGTRLYAIINSEDLTQNSSAGVNYGDIIYETEVNGNGQYSITVAANAKTVTVVLTADDFSANQIQSVTETESVTFELGGDDSATVINNMTKIVDLYFEEK